MSRLYQIKPNTILIQQFSSMIAVKYAISNSEETHNDVYILPIYWNEAWNTVMKYDINAWRTFFFALLIV